MDEFSKSQRVNGSGERYKRVHLWLISLNWQQLKFCNLKWIPKFTNQNLETWSCINKPVMAGSVANLDWRGGDLHHLGRYFPKDTGKMKELRPSELSIPRRQDFTPEEAGLVSTTG